jgi:hypothetical protein
MSMKTEFDGACPTPSAGGDFQGTRGGNDVSMTPASADLVCSPFTQGMCPPPGGKETPSGELGTLPTITQVKDAPESGTIGAVGLIEDHISSSTFTGTK